MGVSINGNAPKWMVYSMGNPINKWMVIGGYPYSRKPPHMLKEMMNSPKTTARNTFGTHLRPYLWLFKLNRLKTQGVLVDLPVNAWHIGKNWKET